MSEGKNMPKDVAHNDFEQLVLDFVHAAYGRYMDVDAMTALMR